MSAMELQEQASSVCSPRHFSVCGSIYLPNQSALNKRLIVN